MNGAVLNCRQDVKNKQYWFSFRYTYFNKWRSDMFFTAIKLCNSCISTSTVELCQVQYAKYLKCINSTNLILSYITIGITRSVNVFFVIVVAFPTVHDSCIEIFLGWNCTKFYSFLKVNYADFWFYAYLSKQYCCSQFFVMAITAVSWYLLDRITPTAI